MNLVAAIGLTSGRQIRSLVRAPWTTIISMVQPVVWLVIFGSLFSAVSSIPGFSTGRYIEYLAPGVIAMTALYAGGWSGMYMIIDMDAGLLDRLLSTPLQRLAILIGPLSQQVCVIVGQSALIVVLSLVKGAVFAGGLPGFLVMLVVVSLLSCAVGALSNALALLVRKINVLVLAVQFLVLPMTFTSSAYMQLNLTPGWIQTAARINPLDWAVSAARSAMLQTHPDWTRISIDTAGLVVFTIASLALANAAFRVYRRRQ